MREGAGFPVNGYGTGICAIYGNGRSNAADAGCPGNGIECAAAGCRLTNNAYALILSKFIFYIHLLYIHIVQQ